MALELPDYVVVAFNLIGLPWPGIDEDQLRAWATGVRQFADDICDNSSQVNQTMRELADSSESSVVDAVAGEWERHHRLLTDLHGPVYDFADALNIAADAVYAQKLVIIGAAAALAAEFTATQIGAIFTLGADEAAVPAEIISTRAIVKFALEELAGVILGKLINFAAQEISDHLNRTITGMLSRTLQAGMEVQSLKLTPKAVSDVAKKLTGQAAKAEDTGSKASAENTSRDIEDETGGSGWSEVINALKQMFLDIAGGLFKDLPGTISRVLGDTAEFLLRFAEKVKAADDDGDVAVTASDTKAAVPKLDGEPGSEPVPPDSGGKEPDPVGADGTPNAHNSPHECQGEGDPVDVATGGVMLTETDVTLPGILPLVLERSHRSTMRPGRWFGRSWMSSLDQRLLVKAGQIRGAFADGRVLTWISPASLDGFPVIPEIGPMWTLRHEEDGAYTVNDPQRGLIWRFERRAGYEDELPLISVTDRIGHEITFNYDAAGRPLSVIHSGGYHVLVSVTNEHVTALTLAGRDGEEDVPLRRFEYDTDGNLWGVINSSGLPMRFTYDDAGRMTSWTDRNGYSYRYTYDDQGRCIRGDGPGGALSGTFTYEPGITRWTNIDGAVTTYEITDSVEIAAITNPLGNTTRWEYDGHGNVTAVIDPLGRVTRYEYDPEGNVLTIIRPDGSQSTAEHDNHGLPLLLTDPDGTSWRQEYDDRGNCTSLTAPDGTVTRFGYDEHGHLASTTGPDGLVTTITCDGAGLPTEVTAPNGARTQYQTDEVGRLIRVTGSDGGITTLAWSLEGQLSSRTFPDGTTETIELDDEGNVTQHVSSAGVGRRYEYGAFNKVTAVIGLDGTRSEFSYDHTLRPTQIRHGSLTWRYKYDLAGQLVLETDYNGAVTSYEYDAAGQVIRQINAAGQELAFTYDDLGNVVSQTAGETVATFGYDFAGRLAWARNPDADLLLERDVLGRVTSETCNGQTVRTVYGTAGQVAQRVTPSGQITRWDTNTVGLPELMTSSGQQIRFGYDASMREITRELPGRLTLTQEWDQRGRMASQVLSQDTRQPGPYAPSLGRAANRQDPITPAFLLQRRDYSYNADGFVVRIGNFLIGNRAFDLDPAGQVTRVTGTGWDERYAYDPAGNVTAAAWPATLPDVPALSLDADAQGTREITGTLVTQAGNIRYRHDAAGRVVSRIKRRISRKPDTWRYEWAPDNRLTAVTTPDGTKWHYRYDPLGRRIAKQHYAADGTLLGETRFAWDGLVLAEQAEVITAHNDENNKRSSQAWKITTWEYMPGTFTPLAQTEATILRDAPQDEINRRFYSIITDITGTPTELTTPDGTLAGYHRRTLWGGTTWHRGGASTPLRFPGQYDDPETGLHYNNQRYYDPTTASYLSPDPFGLAPAPNPHRYASNPTALIDPLGLVYIPYPGHVHLNDQSSDIAQISMRERINHGITPGRNVAIFEIDDGEKLRYIAAASNKELGLHSEQIIDNYIKTNGINPDHVTEMYSERYPCSNGVNDCAGIIGKYKNLQYSTKWSLHPDEGFNYSGKGSIRKYASVNAGKIKSAMTGYRACEAAGLPPCDWITP